MPLALLVGSLGCVATGLAPTDDTPIISPNTSTTMSNTTVLNSTDTDTGTPPGFDCSTVPWGTAPYTTLEDFTRAEDFDFDADGFHISVRGTDLIGKDRASTIKVIASGMGFSTAGTRVLTTGDIVVADSDIGGVRLIDPLTGGQTVIVSNMSYPNGVEVDRENRIYVADQDRGTVRMIDVYSGENGVIADGLSAPNGVILSPDEQVLYVGSFGGGVVYAIDRLGDMDWATPRILYEVGGFNGGFDGINVDVCGNVYVTEYLTGKVYRVTPDGTRAQEIANLPSSWIPNLRWGHDIGGWDSDVLYVADRDRGRLFALETGVPGKKHVLVP